MSLILQGSTSGSVTLQEPAVAGTTTINLPASTGTIALLQTPSFATTIGVGGATAAASGAGITFPATQSASSDANTLDDYEEGTWTPTIVFGGANAGQTGTFAGFYTKTGNQVFATALINLTNKGSSTGTMAIGGLPFTSNSNANYRATSASMLWNDLATSYVYMFTLIGASGTSMEVLAATAAATTNATNPNHSNINNNSSFRVSITYQVS